MLRRLSIIGKYGTKLMTLEDPIIEVVNSVVKSIRKITSRSRAEVNTKLRVISVSLIIRRVRELLAERSKPRDDCVILLK